MSSEAVIQETRKLKLLCLHGFRTSGLILRTQLQKWPQCVLDKFDLFFPDAPFPATGKSPVEGMFDPPYYEWLGNKKAGSKQSFAANRTAELRREMDLMFCGTCFHHLPQQTFGHDRPFYLCSNMQEVDLKKKHMQEFVFTNFDEVIKYIEDCVIKHGPIDGLLGFSQGAFLSAALVGLQAKGLALTKVPNLKFLIIISGGKLKNKAWAEKAFSNMICCPSLHFIGELDYLRSHGTKLLESFVDPVVIYHSEGHTVPSQDEKGLELMLSFLEKIQNEVNNQEKQQKSFRRSSL